MSDAFINSMRVYRLTAALAAAEELGGIYDVDTLVYSANASLAVGDVRGAAHRAADIAEFIADGVLVGEWAPQGAEYAIGLELWSSSNAVLAALGGRA